MSRFEKFQAAVFNAQAKLYDDTNQKRLFVGKINEVGLYSCWIQLTLSLKARMATW
jgi:hypothetical protein